MSIPPAHSLLLLPLLLMPLLDPRLHLPLVEADISGQYHNYNQNSTVCGMSPLNKRVNESLLPVGRSAPYVINGQDVHYGEWPFVVWVKLEKGHCSGVIVTSEVVITAGHCITVSSTDKPWRPGVKTELGPENKIDVVVGKIRFKGRDKFQVKYGVKAVQKGAYFEQRGFHTRDPDFARLWLRKPIVFNDYVLPICIPKDPETIYSLAQKQLFFIGNGAFYDGNQYINNFPQINPNKTQWMMMKTYDEAFWKDKKAGKNVSAYVYFSPYEEDYRKICHGDSGGPLVALDDNKRWSLIGIAVESSKPCQDDDSLRFPQDTFVLMAKIVGIFDKNFTQPPDASALSDFQYPATEQPEWPKMVTWPGTGLDAIG